MNSEEIQNEKRRFIEILIDPSYQIVQNVNSDYMINIAKLRNIIDRQIVPTDVTVDWLRECRSVHISDRDQMRAFDNNVRRIKYFFRRSGYFDGNFRNGIIQEFTVYCSNISHYTQPYAQFESVSWYSDFIESLAMSVDRFRTDFEYLRRNGLIPTGTDPQILISSLRSRSFRDLTIQKEFDDGNIFRIYTKGRGFSIDCHDIDVVIDDIRRRYSEITQNYLNIKSMC